MARRKVRNVWQMVSAGTDCVARGCHYFFSTEKRMETILMKPGTKHFAEQIECPEIQAGHLIKAFLILAFIYGAVLVAYVALCLFVR